MIAEAYIEPKDRIQYEGVSEKSKVINKVFKKARSEVKARRSNKGDD